ncbi:CPBP family intramembrane glutamic endopeptidase [Stackebrandtia nassauensis]|uniref:Abortive infection protein n=1 Tax=Stackebrandtia nassauensis (strain DSM 44728 / CIP 108903 / NRRL B-16338 / NBRC 102104 / LLR-40K-21) TaxID=446470 RepID=D3PX23_STANL|nr:type II CAAX endopeptidase family protein [Stackebrandtia nassauensis]ADD45247.1 Abortive infection protein [Stackebrandtia nassauensis DSM 44728]
MSTVPIAPPSQSLAHRFSLPTFLLVTLLGGWVAVTPLWLFGGNAALGIAGMAMMSTPALGVLAARRRGVRFRDLAHATGLTLGPRRTRTIAVAIAVLLGLPALAGIAIAIAAGSGLATLNPGMSGALLAVVMTPLTTFLMVPTAFGEEWGWRGLLLPHLMERHSRRKAIVVTGLIWCVWHAPLGLFFGASAPLYFIPLSAMFMVFAGPVSWARLATGSVWPAVLAHAGLNASAATLFTSLSSGATPADIGIGAVVGMALWAAALLLTTAILFRTKHQHP